MTKDPSIYLKHILDSVEWIEKDIKNVSVRDFIANVPIQDAIIRRFEIIGEAIRYLPAEYKSKYTYISWQDISDMRNKLIHEYFGIDLNLIWQVIQKDLPIFKSQIEDLLKHN